MVWIWIRYGYGSSASKMEVDSFSVIVIYSEKGGMFDLSVKELRQGFFGTVANAINWLRKFSVDFQS